MEPHRPLSGIANRSALLVTLLATTGVARAQGVVQSLHGSSPGDEFGRSTAAAGDFDGDGCGDLLVGAPGTDVFGAGSGSVQVRSGRDGSFLFLYSGRSPGEALGTAVQAVGDVDLDGAIDWIAAAPGAGGKVIVASGATGATLFAATGAPFSAVAGLGDVNGDGAADWIAGAPLALSGKGQAFVYLGAPAAATHVITGSAAAGRLVFAVSGAGDVDGDGLPDYAIGAPFDGEGRAFVHRGVDGATLQSLAGVAPEPGHPIAAFFGQSLARVGDLDQDGRDDVAVGAIVDGGTESFNGAAIVYSGATGAKLKELWTGTSQDGFVSWPYGIRIGDALGDVSGDGIPDVLVSTPGYFEIFPPNPLASEWVRVWTGGSWKTHVLAAGPAPDFGASCAPAGDVNGDGVADVLVGAPGNGGWGEAFVLTTACGAIASYGSGCAGGLASVPILAVHGCPVPGGSATVRVEGAAGASLFLLTVGALPGSQPMQGGCTLLVQPPLLPFAAPMPAGGAFSVDVAIPIFAALGPFVAQGFFLGTPSGYAASAGVAVTPP